MASIETQEFLTENIPNSDSGKEAAGKMGVYGDLNFYFTFDLSGNQKPTFNNWRGKDTVTVPDGDFDFSSLSFDEIKSGFEYVLKNLARQYFARVEASKNKQESVDITQLDHRVMERLEANNNEAYTYLCSLINTMVESKRLELALEGMGPDEVELDNRMRSVVVLRKLIQDFSVTTASQTGSPKSQADYVNESNS